ncbi:MAG: alanine racemase [Lachnospiraceae bacterium]|nr:alanine racemase [Lachnospiraceae bacterium]
MDKYYRVYASVNLDNIYANMKELKDNTANGTQMVAVIKTDGYGHGAVPVAKTIDDLVAAYAVATIDEALNLRRHNIDKPIYILGFIYEHRMKDAILNDVRMTVYDVEMAKQISKEASQMNKNAYVHIKIDTGMSRIGFATTDEAVADICEIAKLPNIVMEGIFTHFAASDSADKKAATMQLESFNSFNEKLASNGIDIKIKHCSNSAGIIDMPMANMNEVRAGIALYGMYPSDEVNKRAVMLRPALELKSHVIFVKDVPAGVGVSYGSTFITDKPMKIATIPLGYGDGYPRNLSNKGYVLIKGVRCRILGRVCMDQFMVDVTDLDVKKGDVVTLVGKDGDESITVEELAALAGTFNYEFVCNLGKRIPRVYYRDNKVVSTKDYYIDEYDWN